MIGKILSHLLGNAEDDFGATTDTNVELMEFEEGGWVIVVPASTGMKTDVFELGRVARTAGGLLMTEHPSTSVYQMRRGTQEEQVPPRGASRPAAVRRRLAAWGVPLPCGAQRLAVQRARTRAERKQLSRAALHRQNLAGMRSSPGGRRRGSYERLRSR